MRAFTLAVLVIACHTPESTAVDAAPSAAPIATPEPPQIPAPAAWVILASKGKVYTEARRTDVENRVKLSSAVGISLTLDRIAKQPTTTEGVKGASQLARDAQDKLADDASKNLLGEAALMVMHGLVAQACREQDDVASARGLLAALREMPLPKRFDNHGLVLQAEAERAALDQEMQLVLGDKTWQAASSGAPSPKRNVP